MSNNKRIAKNTIFLYFRMMLIMVVNLFTSRVILKALGIEDYGIYNVVGGVVAMFTTACGSLSGATLRFITFELGKKNFEKLLKVFNTAFLAHCVIALIIVALSETIGLWFFNEKMVIPSERVGAAFWVLQISILSTIFSITQVPYTACIIAHEDMKIYAYVGIIEVFLKLIIVYLLFISPIDRLLLYAILICVVQIIVMMIYRYSCRKYEECRLTLKGDKHLFKEMVLYAGSDLIGSISGLAQGQGLNMLLNVFFGPVVNAARAIAYQIQNAVTQFSTNFFTAVRPQIIKSYAEKKNDKMMRLVFASSWLSYYLLLVIVLPLCFEYNYVLSIWLGVYPEYTGSFMILVLIICLIQSIKTPRTTIYHALGKLFFTNMVSGTILCAAFPLAYFFLKMGYPPESVFVAAIITMVLSEIASVLILKRYVNYSIINYLLNVHGRVFFVSILCFLILYFIQGALEESFLRLVFMSFTSVVSVAILGFIIGVDSDMRNRIKIFILSKI